MALLRAHGHTEPEDYSLGILADEIDILSEALGRQEADRMIHDREVLSTIPNEATKPSATKKANAFFKDTIKRLTSGHG